MAFLETVRYWNEGVVAFQEDRLQDSLLSFNHITEPSARIHFNLARVLQRLGKNSECILHLAEALKKDPHLAVAYFCRSVQLFKMKRYDEALNDLDKSESSLRGSTYINYSQLGLDFTLYKFEIQFNRALCIAKKGDIRSAVHMLIEAGKTAEEEVHSRISVQTIQDLTLVREDGSKGKFPSSFTEFEIPENSIFQPSKDMVANLAKKQYVAKAKVISRYGDGQKSSRKQKVITRESTFFDNKQSEPVVADPRVTRTPPLPRRPLPPPPKTGMIASKSAENIVMEVKKEGRSIRNLSIDGDLQAALNARFKGHDFNIDSSSTPPKKPPSIPARPPRRPPPPDHKSLARKPAPLPSDDNILPIESFEYEDPFNKVSSIPPNSTTRNIPPPPSYRPPPPPPAFKPPSPPSSRRPNVPPLPRKNANKS